MQSEFEGRKAPYLSLSGLPKECLAIFREQQLMLSPKAMAVRIRALFLHEQAKF